MRYGYGYGYGYGRRRRGAGTWRPTDLGAALTAWWSADDPADGAVETWTARIGGIAPTQANAGARPVKASTSFDARPGVTFDGVDDNLITTSFAALPSGVVTGEIWAAVQQDEVAAVAPLTIALMYGALAGGRRGFWRSGATGTNRYVVGGGSAVLSDTAIDFSGYHLVGAVYTSTTQFGFIDGAPTVPASAASAQDTVATRLRIGAQNTATASNYWKGALRHILVTTELAAGQRQQIEGWLAWDAGLPGLLPADHPYRNRRP